MFRWDMHGDNTATKGVKIGSLGAGRGQKILDITQKLSGSLKGHNI